MAAYVKISVIIPVYNAAEYLKETLDSLCAQTLKDIEIICVDDGSTDETCDILDKYSKDKRFKILHQNHQNAGAARNAGMECASGRYFAFLDADDIFDIRMLEAMYNTAKQEEADVVVCGYLTRSVTGDYSEDHGNSLFSYGMNMMKHKNIFTREEIHRELFQAVVGWAWDKLFRREFIVENNIKFQSIRTSNDGLFVYTAMVLADKIVAVEDSFVTHRVGDNTSLENTRDRSWNCAFEMLYAVEDKLKMLGCYEIYKQSFLNHVLDFLFWNLETFTKFEVYRLFYDKLKKELVKRYHIDEYQNTYFYSQEVYKKYLLAQESTAEEYLMLYKNELIKQSRIYIEEIQHKQWRFPYEKIKKGNRVILYGAGCAGKDLYQQAVRDNYCTIVMWIDNKLKYSKIFGKTISSVEDLGLEEYDQILIAISKKDVVRSVQKMFESLHIDSEKVVEMM